MKSVNENLIEVGAELKSKGLVKSAAIVKNAEDALNSLKTAQYVGVQGYWIRNRRCWDNCYRQKRTTQPEYPAQEVWMECWEEYKKSINNNESGWEKYAGKDKEIKTGGKEEKEWNKLFINKVSEKVEKGASTPEAIYATIEEESHSLSDSILESSSQLMELADTLYNNDMKDLGEKMASISAEMLRNHSFFRLSNTDKEAGLWQGVKNIGQGIKDIWNKGQKPKAGQQSNEINDWLESLRDQCNTEIKALQNIMRSQISKIHSMVSPKKSIIIEAGKKVKIIEALGGEYPQNLTQTYDTANIDSVPTNVAPTNVAPTNVAPTNVAPTNVAPTNVVPLQRNSIQVNSTQANRYMKIFEQANDALSVFGTFSSENIPQVQRILQPAINNISSIITQHNKMANTGNFEITQMLNNLQALSSATIQAQRGIDAAEKFTGTDLSGDGEVGGEFAGVVPQIETFQTGTPQTGIPQTGIPQTAVLKPRMFDIDKIEDIDETTLKEIQEKVNIALGNIENAKSTKKVW